MNFRFSLLIVLWLVSSYCYAQDKTSTYKADSLEVVSLLNEGYGLEAGAPYKAIEVYKKASKVSKSIDFSLGSFRSYSYTAIVFNDLAVYDSAVFYNKKALPFAEKIGYDKGVAATYINLGNTYQFFGQFDKVSENYFKGIHIFEANADSINVSKSYQNLAALFASIDNSTKEVEYLKQALKTNGSNNSIQDGYVYGDLGLANLRMKNNNEALHFFNLSDSISKLVNDQRLDFFVALHYGDYYLYNLEYEKAIPFYEKSLQINSSLNDVFYKAHALLELGEAHSKLKHFTKAENYLNEVLRLVKESNIIEIQEKVYSELAQINEIKEDYEMAYRFRNLSLKLSDSLKNERYIKQINRLEKQFETKKKDSEIYEQRLLLVEQENVINKKQLHKNIAIGLAVLFLIIALASWLIYQQRQKRKNQELIVLKNEAQINALESLIEGEEKERFRIAKELHDGVNGDLSAIKHKLNSLLKLNNETIKETVEMIDKSCEQVRAISHNLVPPALDNFDLQTAALDYCINMDTTHQPKISFNYYGDQMLLPKIIEVNLYRIIQELVTNSIKHANAKTINVELSYRNKGIQLSVEDDGQGFDVFNLKSDGIGISNVKHRVAFLNGEVDLSSSNLGTSVTIFIDKINFTND